MYLENIDMHPSAGVACLRFGESRSMASWFFFLGIVAYTTSP